MHVYNINIYVGNDYIASWYGCILCISYKSRVYVLGEQRYMTCLGLGLHIFYSSLFNFLIQLVSVFFNLIKIR